MSQIYFDPASRRLVASANGANVDKITISNGLGRTLEAYSMTPMYATAFIAGTGANAGKFAHPDAPATFYDEWTGERVVEDRLLIYADPTPTATQPNGRLFVGIRQQAAPANMVLLPGNIYKAPDPDNRVFPSTALRPATPKSGVLRYDPNSGELFNDVTGRKSAPQGKMIHLGGSRYQDTATGKVYQSARFRRG